MKRLYSLRTLPEDILAALKNCSPRAAVAIKHAIELDEEATRNFVVTNENPTAAACEQFLATLQGGPDEESAQAGAAKPNDDSALPQESRAPVAAATSAADERRERPELDAGDDEREGEGAALAERSDHKPRTPRQPKEANDAPAIIIQGRRGIVLSGQVTVRFDGEAAPQTFDF